MTQKIAYAKPGDRLSARYVNRIVDGANLAINVLGPARSTRLPETDTLPVDLDADGEPTAADPLAGVGSETLTEISANKSTVRVVDPNDTSVWVDVQRYDQLTLQSSRRAMTLVFDT